ncbi:uncharacterized protein PSFLO_04231 [Pseudozyma flocculosa]|uniref:Uncharacterized protein n=1 Tax=Pseudozyma flocculosa TaxID=84751 RepID=A0A5C3F351_9BASI|nr:uncharacterized protein PSFLO_04231 [Pseudozyma flocculosa]
MASDSGRVEEPRLQTREEEGRGSAEGEVAVVVVVVVWREPEGQSSRSVSEATLNVPGKRDWGAEERQRKHQARARPAWARTRNRNRNPSPAGPLLYPLLICPTTLAGLNRVRARDELKCGTQTSTASPGRTRPGCGGTRRMRYRQSKMEEDGREKESPRHGAFSRRRARVSNDVVMSSLGLSLPLVVVTDTVTPVRATFGLP